MVLYRQFFGETTGCKPTIWYLIVRLMMGYIYPWIAILYGTFMMIQWNWAVDSVIEVVKSQSLAAEDTFVGPVGQTCQFTFQRYIMIWLQHAAAFQCHIAYFEVEIRQRCLQVDLIGCPEGFQGPKDSYNVIPVLQTWWFSGTHADTPNYN